MTAPTQKLDNTPDPMPVMGGGFWIDKISVENLRAIYRSNCPGAMLAALGNSIDAIEDAQKLIALLRSQQPGQDEPFGYFKAEPFGWTDCAATDEGAVALYERPAPQATWGVTEADLELPAPDLPNDGYSVEAAKHLRGKYLQIGSADGWKRRDDLAARMSSAPQAAGQSIESAPKGVEALLFSSRNGRWFIGDWGDYDRHNHPRITRWMPLPPPPTPAGEGG